MEGDDRKQKIKDKANLFLKENIKTHISKIPSGILNGFFLSELINDLYYWFQDDEDGKIRLFLSEIYDISEYKEGNNK